MAENKEFNPKLVGFLCNWCSYAGSDLAGTSRMHHDISVRAIRVMCSGRVEPAFVIKAFAEGADGVIIAGCHIPADCHYTNGNFKALARYEVFLPLLDELGIERERLQLHWISASEGEKFATVMNEFVATIKSLGPLSIDKAKLCKLQRSPSEIINECPVIRKSQEFAACEAASSGMIDLKERSAFNMPERVMEPSIVFDPNKCIRCGSCVEACCLQGVEAIKMDEAEGVVIDDTKCVRCGQCVLSCPLSFPDKTITHVRDMLECNMCPYARPVGAVTEKDDTGAVVKALDDKKKHLVVQFAPSIRTTIGEEFGGAPGDLIIKKLYTAFRQMGFDKVCDTNFTADLTIMEEGTEFLGRLQDKSASPMFTSCCPAWIRFVEINYPALTPHLSTAKSPQQMFGAIAKSFFADKLGIKRENMIVVSVMPCLAKKYESMRPEFTVNGDPDVNISISTRELAQLIRNANIDFKSLPDEDFDAPLGASTGAAVIFGTTGGVIEAAVRSAYELFTKKQLPKLDFEELRGLEGIRQATIDFDGTPINIGIAHGLGNARKLLADLKAGKCSFHAIEIMACPGGCIGGGGQPYHHGNVDILRKRQKAIYIEDKNKPLRKSHENPFIKQLYDEFLGEPLGHKAHELLHTHYFDKKKKIVVE